jgi:hypothetical protein
VPRRKAHVHRMCAIAREKIGLLDHVEPDSQTVTAVTIITIDDAGPDGQAVEPIQKMIVATTTLTTKNGVVIENADVARSGNQMNQVGRQTDPPMDHQTENPGDPQVTSQMDRVDR